METRLNVGILLFDNMTMLDAYGPLQCLAMVPQFHAFTFARSQIPVLSDCGARLTPDYDFAGCPALDILVVPGGADVLPQMRDAETITKLQGLASGAQYVTSVCTGALILAEAGLLDGYRATTHWTCLEHLRRYPGIQVESQRVVIDRNRLTGGGVTAGIDFALTLIATIVGAPLAQSLQLLLEYQPAPPFDSGSPERAPIAVREQVEAMFKPNADSLRAFLDARPA
jgi:cyclohexyl-isocyanide hydratase